MARTIEIVAGCEEQNPDHRIDRAAAAMLDHQRAGHHAEPEPADRRRHHEAVLDDAPAERQHAEADGEHQADLVNDRIEQEAAGGGQHGEEDCAREAVNETQAGKRDRHPVHRSITRHIGEHRLYAPPFTEPV